MPPALPKAKEITVRLNGQNGFGVDVDVVGVKIMITGVEAGGSAAVAGLCAGDEVLALAGLNVADQGEPALGSAFAAAQRLTGIGASVEFRVRRQPGAAPAPAQSESANLSDEDKRTLLEFRGMESTLQEALAGPGDAETKAQAKDMLAEVRASIEGVLAKAAASPAQAPAPAEGAQELVVVLQKSDAGSFGVKMDEARLMDPSDGMMKTSMVVAGVTEGGPAATADVQEGDIITSIAGREISTGGWADIEAAQEVIADSEQNGQLDVEWRFRRADDASGVGFGLLAGRAETMQQHAIEVVKEHTR
jgi:predicted metalloprotease with PDZ domain